MSRRLDRFQRLKSASKKDFFSQCKTALNRKRIPRRIVIDFPLGMRFFAVVPLCFYGSRLCSLNRDD